MKTESTVRPVTSMPTPAPAPEAFQAFFDTLRSPAAVCDPDLRLLAANDAFE